MIFIKTNEGNPLALKPVIAAFLAGFKVNIEIINVPVDARLKQRLPLLIADEETLLFDTNVMITYVAELKNKKPFRIPPSFLNLMSLEANSLLPLVVSYLTDKSDTNVDSGIGREILSILSSLEKLLGTQFFAGNSPGYEDVVVFATLYPVFAAKDKLISKCSVLAGWFQKCKNYPAFTNGISEVQPLNGKEAGKAILASNPSVSLTLYGDRIRNIDLKKPTGEEKEAELSNVGPAITFEDIESARLAWNEPLPVSQVKSKRFGQILPLSDQKNYLVTSALPYVNNVPHLGNIIGCVLSADIFARYCRVRGRNTLYICGTDEYGTATETKAIEEKLTPQQICDKYHKLHKEIYDWFDISFDYFGRTTTKAQTEVGQEIFTKLWNNGYLKEMVVQQLFCQPCKRFLSDRFVEGTCPSCGYDDARGDQCDKCGRLTNSIELKNPRCKVCGSTDVISKNSDQVFLDLPKLELEVGLEEWLNRSSEEWTSNSRHIAKSWIREGLKERCITRDLKWGTPVPIEKYKDKVFYVWFDAPIGYISMTKSYTDNWKLWWMNPEADIDYYQFMAKDNVPFHSILFPASLKGTKEPWTLVKHLMATEYLNYEEGKFSKSRGVGVFGNDAIQTGIGADIWRFYLIYMRPESQDSAFSWDDFMTKNNSELLNNLGNFINRSLTFLGKFFESTIPAMTLLDDDLKIVAEVNRELLEYVHLLELCKFRDGLRKILAISKIGNVYFQTQQPWTLTKNDKDLVRCGTVCGVGAQMVFLLMTLLEPFMPGVSKQIREQLNVPKPIFSKHLLPFLTPGHKIGNVSPLFQKLDKELIDSLRKRFAGQQQPIIVEGPTKAKVQNIPVSVSNGGGGEAASPAEIAELETAIANQGAVVRDLKAAKTDKPTLQPQIEKLLALKALLASKTGVAPAAAAKADSGKSKSKKKK